MIRSSDSALGILLVVPAGPSLGAVIMVAARSRLSAVIIMVPARPRLSAIIFTLIEVRNRCDVLWYGRELAGGVQACHSAAMLSKWAV